MKLQEEMMTAPKQAVGKKDGVSQSSHGPFPLWLAKEDCL
jgi:hypothetical protein